MDGLMNEYFTLVDQWTDFYLCQLMDGKINKQVVKYRKRCFHFTDINYFLKTIYLVM